MGVATAARREPTSAGVEPQHGRIPALDGLRGVAVLAVIVFHAGYLRGGYLGVDLFFVLSGYLITGLLLAELDRSGRIDLRSFWGRRARRLLPAVLALVAVVGVVARSEILSVARGRLRDDGIATLAYVANWHAIGSGTGYWDNGQPASWFEHTWSLAIEEQFYVVWPLIVVGVVALERRFRPGRSAQRTARLVGAVALLGTAISATTMILWSLLGGSADRLYLGTDTRAAAVLLGAWAACHQGGGSTVGSSQTQRRVLTAAAVGAAALLGTAWTVLDGESTLLYRGGLLLCGVAAVVIILEVTGRGASPLARPLSIAPLCWLGTISYGLYLWHWPIYQYLYPGRFGLDGPLLAGVRISASLAVAVVSYLLIEQPVRRQRFSFSPGAVAPIGVWVALLALLVAAQQAIDPVLIAGPATASAPALPVATQPMPTAPDVSVLGASLTQSASASAVPPVANRKLLVIGDSVAFGLAEQGFIPRANETRSWQVIDGAEIGCSLMAPPDAKPGDLIHDCSAAWPSVVAGAQPDVVMVLFGAFRGATAATVGGRSVWPCEASYDEAWRRRLESAVDTLSGSGAVVVLVTAPTTANGIIKGGEAERFDQRQQCSNDVILDVAERRSEAIAVDLADWTCPDWPTCRTTVAGADLRPDGLHFADRGAAIASAWLTPRLVEATRD